MSNSAGCEPAFRQGAQVITAFNHTSFTVGDMDRAVKFWTEAMGFKAASVSPRQGDWQGRVTGVPGASLLVAHLFGHGHHMEFIQYLDAAPGTTATYAPNAPGAAHVCFEVSEIRGVAERLVAEGATWQGEIAEVSHGTMRGAYAAYVRDPNGIVIELVQLPPS
jgi:catechol 2,3-dioxygenase-like lactoylglutathione lyase family enzyme